MTSSDNRNLQERSAVWKAVRPFFIGGLSGSTATCCIQPIDMVKVRIQLEGEGTGMNVQRNPLKMAGRIIAEDGFLGMYRGLSAAIARQCTYGLTRLGIFRTLTDYYTPPGQTAAEIPFTTKALCSLASGAIGAIVGTPSDAALVRMQSDGTLPIEQRRGYKNVFDALFRMAREEGIAGFFSGASPTVARGLLINFGMLTTYDSFKKYLGPYMGGKDTQQTRFVCGALSGWTAATCSLPADFVKTRLQKMKPNAEGVMPYKGLFDCVAKVARQEGFLAFYNGYGTFCIRITPHIMLTWVFMDNYKILMNKYNI